MASYLRPRRGKKSTAIAQLTSSNPLKRGEIFFEVPDDGVGTGAGKIKMGDGVTAYADLPYFSEGGGDVGTVLTQAEYDVLTPEEQANGTYWISDASGGSVVIDNALDATSMNAIANKPVAEAITQLNNDLSNKASKSWIQLCYSSSTSGEDFSIDWNQYNEILICVCDNTGGCVANNIIPIELLLYINTVYAEYANSTIWGSARFTPNKITLQQYGGTNVLCYAR